jgi:hypothetical protein
MIPKKPAPRLMRGGTDFGPREARLDASAGAGTLKKSCSGKILKRDDPTAGRTAARTDYTKVGGR